MCLIILCFWSTLRTVRLNKLIWLEACSQFYGILRNLLFPLIKTQRNKYIDSFPYNIEMKTYKVKTNWCVEDQTNKCVINFMLFILILLENCLWLSITGSNPADINRFWSHTANMIKTHLLVIKQNWKFSIKLKIKH